MFKRIGSVFEKTTGYEIKKKNLINGRLCWPGQRAKAQTHYEIDNDFHELYDKAQHITKMYDSDNPLRRQRHYVLNKLLRTANINKADVCEMGCWKGLSSYQIASYIQKKNIKTIFHIFDSFEGLSEIKKIDIPINRKQDNEFIRKHFACSLKQVKQNLKEFKFIKYYKGWIPERFDEVKNKSFSFVHIDVDLYQPIYDSIDFFYPRLIKQGIMVFDDYGCARFPGAKKAIDEYLGTLKNPFFISLPSGQAFLIKDAES